MTTELTVDDVLEAWRDGLPPNERRDYPAFMQRNVAAVRSMVESWLSKRHARAGARPESEQEFLAYQMMLPEQRGYDSLSDSELVAEAIALSARVAEAGVHPHYARVSCAQEYVKTRAEAYLLRPSLRGWNLEVVPYLLARPALVTLKGDRVIAVRDWYGVATFRSADEATLEMTLTINRYEPALNVEKRVSSLGEASREYRHAVEASGEGASSFPQGHVEIPNGPTHTISYNGCVWSGDQKLYDPRERDARERALNVLFDAAQEDVERIWARLDTWVTDENILDNSRRLWSAARAGERVVGEDTEPDVDEERRQQVERLAGTLVHARRPMRRGAWLVFWDLPWLAIKGPIPTSVTGEKTTAAMLQAGFSWSAELKRYQRRPEKWEQAEAWLSAQEVVELLAPGAEWETPTDRVLRHISNLPEGASGWSGKGGPKWKGDTDGTIS